MGIYIKLPTKTAPLAAFVVEKTAGDPFFVRRLLRRLHADRLEAIHRAEQGVWITASSVYDAASGHTPCADARVDLTASRSTSSQNEWSD